MFEVSQKYKEIMDRPIRNRAYISVEIGVINQNAQNDATLSGSFTDWSKGNIFDASDSQVEYATLEQNFMKADGSMCFMPEDNELLRENGVVTNGINGAATVYLPSGNTYDIKGLTIDFGSAYPTRLRITTNKGPKEYDNNSSVFITEDDFGEISYVNISPIEMLGGDKRLRIKSLLMGVGLRYTNADTKSFTMKEEVSPISEDLSTYHISYSFFDKNNRFDVDDDSSFIDNLDTMQKVAFSFGLELDDGNVEWHRVATTYLKDWQNKNGVVTLESYDRMYHMEDIYSLGNKIYKRTAYDEAVSIFEDAGLTEKEYFIDDYLKEFDLINPMPEASHKECLQMLANACRCKIKQDEYGVTMIVPNFALLVDRDEITISDNGGTEWSNSDILLTGAGRTYAELTPNFMRADGSLFFMPEDGDYKNVGFVSSEISDANGNYIVNPKITIDIDYESSYYGLIVEFGGNLPKQFVVTTYLDGKQVRSVTVDDVMSVTALNDEFGGFDKMVLEFTKGTPNSRIIVNKVSFGGLSDYVLKKNNMIGNPIGYREKRVKELRVKLFSFFTNEEGEAEEIEDNNYYKLSINSFGEIKELINPLIATEEHAALVAEWIGNHYANNVSYDVDFRGEPRIGATDIIRMESDKIENLQVEIISNELRFNGAFRGSLELRRAYNMTKGAI